MGPRAIDPRDRFPRDDVSQGAFAFVGAVLGTALGGVIVLVTGSAALDGPSSDDAITALLRLLWHCLVVVFASMGVGLIVAWAWDSILKRATQLGSPAQDLRVPGQKVTLGVAGLVPLAAGLCFMLIAPWLAGPTALLLLAITFVDPAKLALKRGWDVVK